MVKPRRMIWAGYLAPWGEKKEYIQAFGEKSKRK
jgi:hypothetical protein